MSFRAKIISGVMNAVAGILTAIVAFFVALKPALSDNAAYKEKACVYSDSAYDFIAPSPVSEQVGEIAAQPSVKSVYEFYLYDAAVEIGSRKADARAMFSESDNLQITPFNDARLIYGRETEGNALYLSGSIAKKLKAKIGDVATVSVLGKTLNFSVGKIFLDDDAEKGTAIFRLTEQMKRETFGDLAGELRYTGVYIEANDAAAVKNYLRTYIPKGRLLSRDYFDSDIQYDNYVEQFLAQDYSSLINDKTVLQEAAERVNEIYLTDAEASLKTGVLMLGIVMFVVAVANFIAVFVYDKFVAESSGYMMSHTWKSIFALSLCSLIALLCAAGTFGALYAAQTAGLLFVNAFHVRLIGFGMLALAVGALGGVLIDGAICALKKK